MALEDFLRAADFYEVDLMGQWPRFEYPTWYAVFDSSEQALIQCFPSDRPNAWFCAVLNFYKNQLDFGYYPVGSAALVARYQMYCASDGIRLWGKSDGVVFTSHPWAKGKTWAGDDVGVPGVSQFLTDFPYCEPTSLGGNSSAIGQSQRLLITPAVVQPSEYEEENLHVRKVNI